MAIETGKPATGTFLATQHLLKQNRQLLQMEKYD